MASDQIRQMVNFILQEAHEKANEIRVKVRKILYGSLAVENGVLYYFVDNTTACFICSIAISFGIFEARQGGRSAFNDVLLMR